MAPPVGWGSFEQVGTCPPDCSPQQVAEEPSSKFTSDCRAPPQAGSRTCFTGGSDLLAQPDAPGRAHAEVVTAIGAGNLRATCIIEWRERSVVGRIQAVCGAMMRATTACEGQPASMNAFLLAGPSMTRTTRFFVSDRTAACTVASTNPLASGICRAVAGASSVACSRRAFRIAV